MAGGRVVKGAAAAREEARRAVAVAGPKRRKPSAGALLMAAGLRAVPDPVKVDLELLPGGGSRQVPRRGPLPDGVLKCFNRFEEFLRIGEDGELVAAPVDANGEGVDHAEEAEGGEVVVAAAANDEGVDYVDHAEEAEGGEEA